MENLCAKDGVLRLQEAKVGRDNVGIPPFSSDKIRPKWKGPWMADQTIATRRCRRDRMEPLILAAFFLALIFGISAALGQGQFGQGGPFGPGDQFNQGGLYGQGNPGRNPDQFGHMNQGGQVGADLSLNGPFGQNGQANQAGPGINGPMLPSQEARPPEARNPPAAPAGPEEMVVDVRISGNKSLPLDKILPQIKTRPGRPLAVSFPTRTT